MRTIADWYQKVLKIRPTETNRLIVVKSGSRSLFEVPTQPGGRMWSYQLAFPVQLGPTEIGLAASIRWGCVRTVDLNAGNDLVVADRIPPVEPKACVPLNRNEESVHPRRTESLLLTKFPMQNGREIAGYGMPVALCAIAEKFRAEREDR